jgi:hypothetical protein
MKNGEFKQKQTKLTKEPAGLRQGEPGFGRSRCNPFKK